MRSINITTILIALAALGSCKKLVTVAPPTTAIESSSVFAGDASASSAVSGIYSRMMGGLPYSGVQGVVTTGGFASGNQNSVTFYGALSADELVNYPSSSIAPSFYFYGNAITSTAVTTQPLWDEIYQYIYTANAGLEGLADSSSGVSPSVRTQLTGECLFIRAFCYFYLTNLFGDVPLLTTTDYTKNQHAARTAQSAVYTQIVADLTTAETLLNADYSAVQGGERVRPIKWAAAAMLARTYLYMGKWADAETQSSLVINSGLYALPASLSTVFLKNSPETIWSLRPVIANENTPDALTFLLNGIPNTAANNVTLLGKLLAAFEPGDKRRTTWVDSLTAGNTTYYYAYKYRVGVLVNEPLTEYSMVLRLAEQYLIRAEARAQQGDLTGAAADLDMIRRRAGLGAATAATQQDMLTAILHERQTELFTEWGHRWLDLKRTGSIDSVMTVVCPLKGAAWTTNARLWPIPLSEIQSDNQLTQNPGYN